MLSFGGNIPIKQHKGKYMAARDSSIKDGISHVETSSYRIRQGEHSNTNQPSNLYFNHHTGSAAPNFGENILL
jgi:hypothetical protein